mmetsp:Transcript_32733/g.101333  ORF Transcript_32733/g.101333 Transcript_32733/m.101333 type:complete len:119 (-) Transcript_32733:468-824(-)
MSGQPRYRSLWEQYYIEAEAVIFVVDSSDRLRICVAKTELEMLLKHEDICSKPLPIIFFANKMDIPGALTPLECSQQLELERISDRPWHIASSNGLTGAGIAEGMDWLASHISPRGHK